ncbi:MAG TPA: hypothetical protein VF095_03785 [Bacillota bacterium]
MEIEQAFGEVIKRERTNRFLSQEELAHFIIKIIHHCYDISRFGSGGGRKGGQVGNVHGNSSVT